MSAAPPSSPGITRRDPVHAVAAEFLGWTLDALGCVSVAPASRRPRWSNGTRALLLAMAALLLVLGAGCNRNAPVAERGNRLASLARHARLEGRSAAEFPCAIPQSLTLGDLSMAMKYATVALVEPGAREVSPAGGDDVRTWVKFRVVEMLRDRRTAGLPLAGVPPSLQPVGANEFVAWYCGGSVTINGVEITERGDAIPDFAPRQRYLLFFELTRTGQGVIAGRNEGVFRIDGDALRPVDAASANTPFDRDLLQHVGNTVSAVKQYLAAHS